MPLSFDPSRIAPYTRADNQPKPTTIRQYGNGQQNLFYVNASHVSDADNPTYAAIAQAMNLKPGRVIIEARPDTPLNGASEVAFANSLAAFHAIPVTRAEPDDADLFADAAASGYAAKDVMALYLLRMVPQDRKMGRRMDEPAFAERAEGYLSGNPAFASILPAQRLTYGEFKEQYAPRLDKDVLEVNANDFAPFATSDATYFQRLSAHVGHVREKHIVASVAAAFEETDNVLVVYGGAHRTMSGPVWEATLGKGVDIKPQTPQQTQSASITPPDVTHALAPCAVRGR